MSWGNRLTGKQRSRLRVIVIARDKVCQLAYPGICTVAIECVDHVTGDGGDVIDNLQGACNPCNLHKGKPGRNDPPAPRVKGAWW